MPSGATTEGGAIAGVGAAGALPGKTSAKISPTRRRCSLEGALAVTEILLRRAREAQAAQVDELTAMQRGQRGVTAYLDAES